MRAGSPPGYGPRDGSPQQGSDDAKTLFNPAQIQSSLAFWIEGYYNRERHHPQTCLRNRGNSSF